MQDSLTPAISSMLRTLEIEVTLGVTDNAEKCKREIELYDAIIQRIERRRTVTQKLLHAIEG